jgi:hypothetical protein
MAGIPNNFITQSPVVASYDYVDLASGTGIVEYNGVATRNNTTLTYKLMQNETETEIQYINGSSTTGTTFPYTSFDVDFDMPAYNLPQTVKGTATFTMTASVWGSDTSNAAAGYINLIVYKYDGSTETQIGTARSITIGDNGMDNAIQIYRTISIPVALTETRFKKGEIFRVTVQGIISAGANLKSKKMVMWLDPKDGNISSSVEGISLTIPTSAPSSTNETRYAGTARTTQVKAFIPYKIDL